MVIEAQNAQETYNLGKSLGCRAVSGQIYCLDGELGTGKTVFTQGFAAGLGVKEPVSSPTFTIVQEYTDGRLPLYHFDVYRIGDASEMYETGYEEYFFGDGVCVVEWGGLIAGLLPEETVFIRFERNLEKGFDYRRITVQALGSE